MKTIVIIPSYEPEEKLIPLTQQLIAKDFEVVVVDDGSESSTMYFNGQIINKPTTNGRNIEEREVSDIVYL